VKGNAYPCKTCAEGTLDSQRFLPEWEPRWYPALLVIAKVFMILTIIAFIAAVLFASAQVALAAVPEEEESGTELRTMTVTVEDITAVMEQLSGMDEELDMLAQLVWAEARGVGSRAEQAAVIWCALNRVDAGFSDGTISGVVRARSQFAWGKHQPVKEKFRALAQDVVTRWLLEKRGVVGVGRVLPVDYLYFAGRNGHNWFRKAYRSRKYWDWSLPDVYAVNEGESVS
jgi:hypothetical protein